MNITDSIKKTEFRISEGVDGDIPFVVISGIEEFDASKVFDCGQCFRFDPFSDTKHRVEICGVAMGKFLSFAEDGGDLIIYNADKAFFEDRLVHYLGLDLDYKKIREDIISATNEPYIKSSALCGKGIRLLRQEKWEALCSFIISQNNNIPRIKKLISSLCERCGEKIDGRHMLSHGARAEEYAFPSPEAVLSLGIDGLRELKVGFRSSYIYDAAKKIVSGEIDLQAISSLPSDDCLSELMKIKGVGLKVASCTALFGMAKYDAFPIDVWIRRVLAEKFSPDFNYRVFGDYAGIAQQYMFYAARFDT